MTSRRVLQLLLIVCLVAASGPRLPARQGAPLSPSLFGELRWRNIGPMRAGRTKAAAGVPSQPYTFYIGMVNGGVWKTTDAGRTWTADLRRPADRIDRVGGGRAVGSERDLRRQRRGPAASRPGGRRRHLQVHRCRPDVDPSRAARRAADPEDRRRSERIRTGCSSRSSGHPVRPERGARHLPFDRRRQDVPESALQGREHRRQGRGHRSRRIRTSSTRRCGSSGRGRGRTPRGAALDGGIFKSTDGGTTWKQLDATACPTSSTPSWRSRRAIRGGSTRVLGGASSRTRTRGGRGGGRRTWGPAPGADLSLRRCRRDLGAHHHRHAARRAASTKSVPHRRSQGSRHADRDRRRDATSPLTAARPSCRSRARPAATTTRTLDQPERPEHHAARHRSGRGRLARTAARPGARGTRSRPRRCTT